LRTVLKPALPADKSTLLIRFNISERMTIVNPDTIARELKPDHRDEPSIVLQAGRIAMQQRRTLIQARQSFALETTLIPTCRKADSPRLGYIADKQHFFRSR
jgi:predicted ABC-type ATPase